MENFDKQKLENLNATKHYSSYPKGEFPPFLAYGFRPIFLLLAPYIIISIILWSFTFAGYINLSFIQDPLTWHMYEMLFGVGIAGFIAFFLTGAPELFPGTIPVVGKHLAALVICWALGRIGFWFMDFVGIYTVAILNIASIIWIVAIIFKPVVLDPRKRHLSLAINVLVILALQIWFFASLLGFSESSSNAIIIASLGAFIVLIILALRRINMEAINELLEDEGIDETFFSRAPRYNLAVFCISLYTFVEFFYPANSVLAYLAIASAASVLAIINDFILKDHNILLKPFVMYMISVLILTSIAYAALGYDYLNEELYALNHFRHFLTTGVYGLVFYLVMMIISTIHTGRHLFTNIYTSIGVILIIVATFTRALIPFYEEFLMQAYIISSILWAIPFIIYIKICFPYLLNKRADGIPG
ncbi:NnrS family protein [Halarcobacter sp.]|uniref:NnrS family protein n=1 Tax=Halarcobacter sp. TaxID=2321133 RepID=UPI0029F5B279|nr:NnrS family protein [Halarcobacter sp.]